MAHLFGNEYHEHSNSWYYKNSIQFLSADDLEIKKFLDENNLLNIIFTSTPDAKKKFPYRIAIKYDANTRKIVSHSCSHCGVGKSCVHFLSIIDYSYKNLGTEFLAENLVQAYQKKIMNFNEYWQRIIQNSLILVSDLFNEKEDKIRIYFSKYEPMDVRLMSAILGSKDLSDESSADLETAKRNLQILPDVEVELLAKLQKLKCSYSRKGTYFTIYKADFIQILIVLGHLSHKVYIKETGDKLLFKQDQIKLNFMIRKVDEYNFVFKLADTEIISAFYSQKSVYVFKKNEVFCLHLPLDSNVIKGALTTGYELKREDLVYFASVVTRQLNLLGCFLDFEEGIDLPVYYDNYPVISFYLEKVEDQIFLSGFLKYTEQVKIPMSLLRYPVELIRYELDEKLIWFYLPPQVKYEVYEFVRSLPEASEEMLEKESKLIFSGEQNIAELKRIVFEKSSSNWSFELSDSLKQEFIYKAELKPIINTYKAGESDWFTYDVIYEYKDVKLSHEELRKFFKTKEKYLQLKDGRLLFITNQNLYDEINGVLKKSEKVKDDIYKMKIHNIPYLYQILNQDGMIKSDSYLQKVYKSVLDRKLEEVSNVPEYLKPVMRSYQKSGFHWLKMLQKYHFNGILADDMGLGKTIQAISILSDLPGDVKSLIICPKTLIFNWVNEIEKFNSNLTYIVYEGDREERENKLKNINVNLVITSYTLILNDISELKQHHFEYIILDEAQHIKNSTALRTKAIKELNGSHRLALTGTPMENSPFELWSIFDFLMPGYLNNLNRFRKDYFTSADPNAQEKLIRLISPFILRRHKRDVLLELPDKQEQVVQCQLSPLQEKLYLQVLDSVKENFNRTPDQEISYIHVLSALMKLRQICNHPCLVEKSIKNDYRISGKMELLSEIILDAIENEQKILIFSQFVEMLKLLEMMLIKNHIVYEYMDGQTKNRKKAVDNFNNNRLVKAFLISLKTGGFGLNLTSADTVIIVDPWWNPMVENQAIDRAYRIGQTKKVLVYKTVTKGTVEEKIVNLQKNKREMFENFIENGQNVVKSMRIEELKELFEYH